MQPLVNATQNNVADGVVIVLVRTVAQVEHKLLQEDVVVLQGIIVAQPVIPAQNIIDILTVKEGDAAGC